ncbi:ArfGap-domain-containing protein [Macrolepiota fuliginosa MF-IS2]|uniref:ArfGap-domain-containing protein n=1 Tax=Macrolepiota fuliginosa MF-IS2 TaxID=1400762 RepID=A0A9P5XCG3_9AGAR|nr:ArfGap-domain-containing protein [Macrolepiota fuliginosa MF-IS2]
MSRQDKATTERNSKTLRELVKLPENKVCADCKRNDPRWASWNIGVFLCIRCSGIHRGMGTHISKVKSVDLDMWTPDQMGSIQKWGNRRANLYWEAHLKAGHIPPEHKMESFIRSKYESRRWAMDGPPPPDPSVLESNLTAELPPVPPPQEQPPATARSSHTPSNSTSLRSSAFTTRQPQTHQLLSSNFNKPNATQAPVQPATQPTQPAQPPPPQDDLFSLDFHAPPQTTPSNVAQQPKKDVKQDILSLFSAAPGNSVPNPMNQFGSGLWNTPSQPQQPAQPTSMIGSTGAGAWGTSSGWGPAATAPPAQPNVWGTATTNPPIHQDSLFNTNDVWGNTSTSTAGTGLSTTSQKKDDVFGDIWGSFK